MLVLRELSDDEGAAWPSPSAKPIFTSFYGQQWVWLLQCSIQSLLIENGPLLWPDTMWSSENHAFDGSSCYLIGAKGDNNPFLGGSRGAEGPKFFSLGQNLLHHWQWIVKWKVLYSTHILVSIHSRLFDKIPYLQNYSTHRHTKKLSNITWRGH